MEQVGKNLDLISEKFENIAKDLTQLEKNNVQEIQTNILQALYQIRKDLLEEIQEFKKGNILSSAEPTLENNQKYEDLAEENRRLNYRITHLVRGFEEIQKENEELRNMKKN